VAASRRRARPTGRRWPTWFRWRAAHLRVVQSQPPGRGPVPEVRVKRLGRDSGAGLWRTCFAKAKQGPCRNHAQSSSRGPSRPRPGQPGRQGPEEGQARKPTSACLRGQRLSGGDAIRRVPGRAREQRHPIPILPEALPSRGPPDLPPVARKCLHWSDNVQAHQRLPDRPWRRCSAGPFPAVRMEERRDPYCASKSSTSRSVSGRAWQERVKPASISQGSSEKFSSMVAAPSMILQRQVQHMPPAQE